MTSSRLHSCAALVLLLSSAACISSNPPFMHVRDRVDYAIQPDELKKMDFKISTEVFARDLSRGDSPDSVIILPEGTRGTVLEAGENWLRVSFDKGGAGVIFLADTGQSDDGYWLATEVDGQPGYTKLSLMSEKVLRIDGQAYKLISGSNAYLIVEKGDLESVIEKRRHLGGRKP